MTLPLEGIRIIEMGQLIAIPHAIKLLASMGAQVIRVESCVRLEGYRAISLYENNPEGEYWNRGANFYEQNAGKLGLTLDLTKTRGLEVLRHLIGISDVFAENFTPRVIKNFHLEYEDLRQLKPDIIMVSSTGYGYSGPWANFGAIGFSTEAAGGLAHITGYEGGPPTLPEIPYADYIAAEHTAFAIMAALTYRARTGKGQFIDLSQAETVSSTVPEALMDYTVNQRMRERMGNRDLVMAPHGCYRCGGDDKWITIAIASETQWNAVCEVLNAPAWSRDSRFSDPQSRRAHRDELDSLINEATQSWDAYELMNALQGRGVPAGAVLNGKELLFDPHLQMRKFYQTMPHHPGTGMLPLPYGRGPWRMSETDGATPHPAPLMGEHNRFVLSELLGNVEADVASLGQESVTGAEPVGIPRPTVIPLEEQKRQGRILDYEEDFRRHLRDLY